MSDGTPGQRALPPLDVEGHLNEAQRLAGIGSWEWEAASNQTGCSANLYVLFGAASDTSSVGIGSGLAGHLHPDDRSRALESFGRPGGAPPVPEFGFRMIGDAGATRYVHARQSAHYDAEGRLICVRGVLQDVTGPHLADESIRRRERFLRAVADAVPGMTAHWTKDLRCDFANKEYLTWFGRSAEEMLGSRMQDVLGPELFAKNRQYILGVLRGEPQRFERAIPRPDGRLGDTWAHYIPDIVGGVVEGFFVMVMDISTLKQAQRDLAAALREKEVLLREVYHRVNNNLQVIGSLIQLQLDRAPHPEVRAALGDTRCRVQSMAILHESLNLGSGGAEIDLGRYLKDLTVRIFNTNNNRSESVRIHHEFAAVEVKMDRAVACGLILNELLSNCLKHAFPGNRGGDVNVRLERLGGGNELRLSVSDTGIGLPRDLNQQPGKSMGLQIVTVLAAQLEGRFETGPGPGAAFAVTFEI